MKRLPAYVFIVVATVGAGSITGCGDPLCMTVIGVDNDSATDASYDVVIDDELVGTLSPSQSGSYDVSPGSHTVQINFASGGVACGPFSKIVRECTSVRFGCES